MLWATIATSSIATGHTDISRSRSSDMASPLVEMYRPLL
jgi:hypothetical protein